MKPSNFAILGVLCAVALLAGCGPSHTGHKSQPKASRAQSVQARAVVTDSEGQGLRKGDEVMLTKLGYGCQSRNMLARAIEEQNLGKMSELQATIGNFPECINVNEFPGQHWTVTAVHPPLVQIGTVNDVDVRSFKQAAPSLGKSNAKNDKKRYWVPPRWLLKLSPQRP